VIAAPPRKTLARLVNSLSVLNRTPQGAAQIYQETYPDNCGPGFPFRFRVYLSSRVINLNYALLSFFLEAFRGYEATSSTESAHTHGVPSESVSSVASTSQTHAHNVQLKHGLSSDETPGYNRTNGLLTTSDTVDHTATTLTDGGHTHSVSGQTTGGATSAAGSAHSHGMVAGIYESTTPGLVTVKVNSVDRTSVLGGGSGFTTTQTELALQTSWFNFPGWNLVELTPDVLGRIYGSLSIVGFIQST
jgi:hypothetical protein